MISLFVLCKVIDALWGNKMRLDVQINGQPYVPGPDGNGCMGCSVVIIMLGILIYIPQWLAFRNVTSDSVLDFLIIQHPTMGLSLLLSLVGVLLCILIKIISGWVR